MNGNLSQKQKLAIEALAAGSTNEQAAEAAGVVALTVYRWLKKPEFDAALKARCEEVLDSMAERIYAAATEKLFEAIADGKAGPGVLARLFAHRQDRRAILVDRESGGVDVNQDWLEWMEEH